MDVVDWRMLVTWYGKRCSSEEHTEWSICGFGWEAGEVDTDHDTGTIGARLSSKGALNGAADVGIELLGRQSCLVGSLRIAILDMGIASRACNGSVSFACESLPMKHPPTKPGIAGPS